MGITIAIVSALLISFSQIFLKKSYKELNPSVAFFFDSIFGLLIWLPIGFIFGGKLSDIPQCLIYAIISAIFSEALVFYALSKGDLSVASVLTATYPIYTLIFAYVINKEVLLPAQFLFILITILGIILTCVEEDFKLKRLKKLTNIIPIMVAICIGLSDTFTKKVINETSSFSFLIAIAIVQIPIALIYLKISKQNIFQKWNELKVNTRQYKYSILGSLFNILGTGCLFISFNYTLVSIASPLTTLYIPIVLIYSVDSLKEKISTINLIGIITAFIGTFGVILIG